jgi:predicted transcriptional regulator
MEKHVSDNHGNILILSPNESLEIFKGLASDIRLQIIEILNTGPLSVNDIAQEMQLPQSSIATHLLKLQKVGLIKTESKPGMKGLKKLCSLVYDEIIINFPRTKKENEKIIEVEMPVGLFAEYDISLPCGLCSTEGVIGYFDVPNQFLNPERIKAGLLWFGKGYIEYQFPNNLQNTNKSLKSLEVSAEVSSETMGTNINWLTEITMMINKVEIGQFTCRGDFGENRGRYTPEWRSLNTSQYGLMKTWTVNNDGAFIDGVKIGNVNLSDLNLPEHKSIRIAFVIKDDSLHPGGLNIFGKGFGNYNQDIILKLTLTDD